jgi:hypothetical protein
LRMKKKLASFYRSRGSISEHGHLPRHWLMNKLVLGQLALGWLWGWGWEGVITSRWFLPRASVQFSGDPWARCLGYRCFSFAFLLLPRKQWGWGVADAL